MTDGCLPLAGSPQISQITWNKKSCQDDGICLLLLFVLPNPRDAKLLVFHWILSLQIFVCDYPGYYSANDYPASVVWPQFVLMLCLSRVKIAEGSPSGDLQETKSQLIPGETERETEGAVWPDLSWSPPARPAQREKIEIFTINSLTEIFFVTLQKFLNIYLNSGPKYFVYDSRYSGRALVWPQTRVMFLQFQCSLNIALTQPLIAALTYQHPSVRQLSSLQCNVAQ